MIHGTQTGALWQPRGMGWGGSWDGGARGREHMYIYGWFILYMGFPGGSDGKEPACNVGDLGLIPRLGKSRGEGNPSPIFFPAKSHG